MMYYVYLCLLWPLSLLPLCVMYRVSDLLYLIFYHLLRYRIRVTRKNLEMAFPEKSAAERLGIERRFYRHLCDQIVETVHQLSMSDNEIDRRITAEGGELVEREVGKGRPVMVYLGHYCNWEWSLAITRHYTAPSCAIYRPIKDKGMDRLMLQIRSIFGCEIIPQGKTVRTLVSWHRKYGAFAAGFIADQRPNSANLNHWTTFFGHDTAYPPGGEDIGRKMNAAYFYLDVSQPQRGYQHLALREIEPLDDGQPYPYTRAYYRMMEQTIRRAPHLWLWSHRRWLFDKDNNTTTYKAEDNV